MAERKLKSVVLSMPIQPTKVGNIEFDALITSSEDYKSSVTSYPVENGGNVSDHIINEPIELSLTLFVSPTPVTWADRFGGVNTTRPDAVIAQLKAIRDKRQPITVTTSRNSYKNMVLKSFKLETNKESGYAYEIPIELTQINMVETRKEVIPSDIVAKDTKNKVDETASRQGQADTTPTAEKDGKQQGYKESQGARSTEESAKSGQQKYEEKMKKYGGLRD